MTWCTGLALVGALAGCGQSAAVRVAGSWGQAMEMPGLAAWHQGGCGGVDSVSCAPGGGCAARRDYQDRRGQDHFQGFVVSQTG